MSATLDQAQLLALAERALESPAHFVVSARVSGSGRGPVRVRVQVLVDGDQGISIDECALISRRLAGLIDGLGPDGQPDPSTPALIEGAYHLEVGSPGLDHPLSGQRQFAKNVGRLLEVTLAEGGQKLEGTLVSAGPESIELELPAPKGKRKPHPGVGAKGKGRPKAGPLADLDEDEDGSTQDASSAPAPEAVMVSLAPDLQRILPYEVIAKAVVKPRFS